MFCILAFCLSVSSYVTTHKPVKTPALALPPPQSHGDLLVSGWLGFD